MKPIWRNSFFLFTRTTKNKTKTTKRPGVEQRQDLHEVRHVSSIGVILSLLREYNCQLNLKIFFFNVSKGLIFQMLSSISTKLYAFCIQLHV